MGPALASPDLESVFRELERTVNPDEERSLEATKARLAEAYPDWWEGSLPPGDLRSALAAWLSRDEVAALLQRAGRQAENLACDCVPRYSRGSESPPLRAQRSAATPPAAL